MHTQIPAAATAAFLLALAVPAAQAHTRLEASSPRADGVVSPAPAQVRLQFSDPLELPFSKIKLVDGRGAVLQPAKIAIDPADPRPWWPRPRDCAPAPTWSGGAPSPATATR